MSIARYVRVERAGRVIYDLPSARGELDPDAACALGERLIEAAQEAGQPGDWG